MNFFLHVFYKLAGDIYKKHREKSTQKYTEVRVRENGTDYYFTVYYADGSETTTAIDNTNADVKAVKVIENGQLFIIKNGVRYNALGVEVR